MNITSHHKRDRYYDQLQIKHISTVQLNFTTLNQYSIKGPNSTNR